MAALDPLLPAGTTTMVLEPARMAAANGDLNDALDAAMEVVPEGASWLGWSLGGQVALAAQQRYPERVGGVLTLCSTPCFVAAPGWPAGMDPSTFDAFRNGLAADPDKMLRQFCGLVAQGSASPWAVQRELQALDWPGTGHDQLRGLAASLEWLGGLDQRAYWRAPAGEARHLFGAGDALVDPDTPRAMGLASERFAVAANMGHWPMGGTTATAWIREALERVSP